MIITKVEKVLLDNYWNYYIQKEAYKRAIKTAKSLGYVSNDLAPLKSQQFTTENLFQQSILNIIANTFTSGNLLDFGEGWVGIICSLKKNKNEIIVHPLMKDKLSEIYLDFSSNKALPKAHYSSFVKNYTDKSLAEKMFVKISQAEKKILNTSIDFEYIINKNNQQYQISSHAINRWNERINNDNETITLNKRNEIVQSLQKEFLKSIYIYNCEKTQTKFFLEPKNMIIFAISVDNTIVTIWRNNYGFSKENINEQIVLLQLNHLINFKKTIYKKTKPFLKAKNSALKTCEAIENSIEDINTQIKKLENQKNEMNKMLDNVKEDIEQANNSISNLYDLLEQEENKILKIYNLET